MRLSVRLVFVVLLLASSGSAGTIVESFEGYTPGPNIPMSVLYPDFLVPGISTPFTFASGVTLSLPAPNLDVSSGNVLLGDFALGTGATDGLENNGVIEAADVPNGTAYIVVNGESNASSVTFTLPAISSMVGADVDVCSGCIANDNVVTMNVYNSSDVLIGSTTISGVAVDDWASNFISMSVPGISSVQFEGVYLALDDLTFTPNAAPEPSSWILCTAGLGAILLRRRCWF